MGNLKDFSLLEDKEEQQIELFEMPSYQGDASIFQQVFKKSCWFNEFFVM
jgi:hypothetical protein